MNKSMSATAILTGCAIFVASYSLQSQAKSAAENKPVREQEQHNLKTLDERFSYAFGADLAEKFKQEGIELNVEILASAMQDNIAGEMKMSTGEITATLELYQKIHAKEKATERAVIAEKNKKEGEQFLAKNAKKEGVIVTESGLQYKVIHRGKGGYNPTKDDEVTVHYRGTFVDGTEFDSTHQRNQTYSVKVEQLIKGWSEAVQLMSQGAKWELYIPAEIAYGESGSGTYVGPNAVLIFEVELLEIEKQEG